MWSHYLVAKIVAPLLVGRGWCGWGCWIWMVLDYLPFRRSPGRRVGWGWVRVAHFALSLGVVGLLARMGYDHGFTWQATDGLWWFLGGCSLYYLIGISLAFALEDNRAFCKYVCPGTGYTWGLAALYALFPATIGPVCSSTADASRSMFSNLFWTAAPSGGTNRRAGCGQPARPVL